MLGRAALWSGCALLAACSFGVEPVGVTLSDASVDLSVSEEDGATDDLTVVDLSKPDLMCSPSCAGIACGTPNACGAICCGSGCTPVACSSCQMLNACGNGCTNLTDNTSCPLDMGAGFCNAGACNPQPVEYTFFGLSTTNSSELIPDSIELGMKFTYDRNAAVERVRFLKPSGATGSHVGHLWDGSGNLLGTATFTSETASGWQEAALPSPIPITAGQSYMVSYSEHGGFALTQHYFDNAVDMPPFHAPMAAGMFASPEGALPNTTFNNSNYWVDVVVKDPP